jgi:hypothetical protein
MNPSILSHRTRAGLLTIAAALLSGIAAAELATPVITGPVPAVGAPGTDLTRNYPQMASEPNFDLSKRGSSRRSTSSRGRQPAIRRRRWRTASPSRPATPTSRG